MAMTVVAAAGVIAGAGQASADVPPFSEAQGSGLDECDANRVCLYTSPRYNENAPAGSAWMWQLKSSQPNLHVAPTAGDEPDSVFNNTDSPVTLYQHYYVGLCVTVGPGRAIEDLDHYGLKNQVSSVRISTTYVCPSTGSVSP
ncbi:peptidase inhibitor family I36 protein [Herbihabitans rhizosphaerae]|nr:peptidase inhibitor family I36 protein [Herbihabitans rhizosphaerae]